jgi:hypothetical protein
MLESLVNHPLPIYIVLGIIALGLLIALWKTRKRGYALGLAGVAVAAFLVWLVISLIPTDQKQIAGAIQDMGEGVRKADVNRIFANISDQFRLGGMQKETFRTFVADRLRRGDVTEVVAYDLEDAQVSRPNRTATIEFKVKPHGNAVQEGTFYFCKATFVLDSDNRWRLKDFILNDPVTNRPLDIPSIH